MNLSVNGRIRRTIGVVFAAGVAGSTLAPAHAQGNGSTQLQGVEVTGSRIRRVETETANLVQVLDRKQIEATGAATMGELVQAIPSITGAPLNASANNNGGSITGGGGSYGGSTSIDIRGLGPKRTLVLLDGQRLNNADPDAIPANMIERIEVLKAGAGSTYGTDAIGGVVNFITRKNFSGTEVNAQWGETERGDGAATGGSVTWGSTGSKGNVMFGANYNRQNDIRATDRRATAGPIGYSGPLESSSSRSPTGKFNVGTGAGYTDSTGAPCASVTLIAGTNGTSKADYRCFVNSHNPATTDRYNYQPANLDLDPTLHESLFGAGSYRITDTIKWYGQGYFTHAFSQRQLASEPFDNATIQGIYPLDPAPTISAQNVYNPFGVDITSFAKRSTDAGPRILDYNVDQYQLTTGLKGTLLDRFDWNLAFNYGKLDLANVNRGYLDFSKVFQQIGPSFFDAAGVAHCGTAAAPIPNCAPVNVFGTTGNTLGSLAATVNDVTRQDQANVTFDVNGDLFKLPAGMVSADLGFEYRSTHLAFEPDVLQSEFELSEANEKSTNGGYNVREFYGEVTIPVLANLPGAKSLSLDVGGRYSDFSTFGSHTSGKYQLEYRPYSDLMIRATYADTFRAPNVSELFGGATQSAPAYSDPCLDPKTGAATAASLAGHSKACAGVQIGATQPNSQGNGVDVGNAQLKPEHGYSTDFGIVFSPSFYKPLSVTVDYWHYSLKDGVTGVSLPEVLNDCYSDNNSAFCGNAPNGQPYFTRANSGGTTSPTTTIANSTLPLLNSFSFWVNGWDYSVKLSYPKVHVGGISLGSFETGVDLTYVDRYQVTVFDPASGAVTSVNSVAGTFDPATVIAMPRWKGLAYLFWSKGPFSATLEDRYTSNLEVGDTSYPATDCYHANNGDGDSCYRSGYVNYVDISGSYNVKPINTTFTVGINDLFDDGIQQTYSQTYAGAPMPVYDVRGRNFYAKAAIRFK
jgi:outer membrane receptor protein involved in Fe transport